VNMPIIVTGDRFWPCHPLAASVVQRLRKPYGPDIVIVHGGATGVEQSFDTASKGLGIIAEACGHGRELAAAGNGTLGAIHSSQVPERGWPRLFSRIGLPMHTRRTAVSTGEQTGTRGTHGENGHQ